MLNPTEMGLFSDALACRVNEREIIIDDLGTAKSRPAHRFRQFIWVTDQANVNLTCSIVLPKVAFASRFAKSDSNSSRAIFRCSVQ